MDTPKQTFSGVLINTHACDKIIANQKRLLCPACKKATVLYLLPSTQVKDLPVKCKRCRAEMILNIPAECLSP